MRINVHQEWFRFYSYAMLELDEQKIFERIENAMHSIQARMTELNSGLVNNPSESERERQDITYALNNLKRLQVYGMAA
jgi:transposase